LIFLTSGKRTSQNKVLKSFIYSFDKYLQNAYYVSGLVEGNQDMKMSKIYTDVLFYSSLDIDIRNGVQKDQNNKNVRYAYIKK
jgi:hypothetical protein